MWSCASTETPMVFPMIQWFGKGFGHMGSTSNRGAWTPAASTTARFSSTADPIPSATTTARKDAPTYTFRFMLSVLLIESLDTIHDSSAKREPPAQTFFFAEPIGWRVLDGQPAANLEALAGKSAPTRTTAAFLRR